MTSRFAAPIGSLAAAALFAILSAAPARADAPLTVVYQGQSIRFSHVDSKGGAPAIGVGDPGFAALLRSTDAVLTWKPGERYVLITTSVPTVVSFAIGDRRYDIGPIVLQAAFAPYQRGNEAYLPLNEVLRGLDLALREDGATKVLQPQLASLEVRALRDRVTLLAHGGAPLHPRVIAQSASAVTYAFDGVGTALVGTRQINTGGVRSVQVTASGTVRAPVTTVIVALAPGAAARAPQNNGERDVVLAVTAGKASPQSVAEESPTPEPEPSGTENAGNASEANASGPAIVTSVSSQASDSGVIVTVAVNGNASFTWHRLRDPDNRFWVDVKNAQLQGPPIDQAAPSPVISMRARQIDAATVRVALTLGQSNAITVSPSSNGLQIQVGNDAVSDDAARSGSGTIGSIVSSGEQNPAPVTPAPADNAPADNGTTDTGGWKFGPRSSYVPANPRLIVIDPGHGGSDSGTEHGGLKEADLTLDMARRLRDILVARGWEVKLTREADVDVYAPNDSAHDELQARVDVANKAGARLFVSVHANAFINSGPSGTTCYISKPEDVPLGHMIEAQLAQDGTKDDGVIKAHYYVTYHTRMPAVLIETAFLTNPTDYALLASAAWRQKVAQEIADGIGQYTRAYPASNQGAQ
ncbi:MAG: N-acetylmuramoyl-L-alanine amidase [Candidatus Eremiobacteraeota bacterium]|nr:N-acetylmuramoyl-L-alanine amidase [Candidatus Eremiobacteraeota bacterium]